MMPLETRSQMNTIKSYAAATDFTMAKNAENVDEECWQDQESEIAAKNYYILKNCLWTDCKFVVGTQDQQEFSAHKLILSMATIVFEKMFKGEFTERDEIKIVDIEPDIFSAMLEYIYTKKLVIRSFDQACRIYFAADKYMVKNLLNHCKAYILENISEMTACQGFEFAQLFHLTDVIEQCRKIISKETSKVLAQKSFRDVEFPTILMILDLSEMNITEVNLFSAIESWTEAEFSRKGILGKLHTKEQQDIYSQITPKIRFMSMSAETFAKGPASSPMLTLDQSHAILLRLVFSECSQPWPEGFSLNTRSMCAADKSFTSLEDQDLDWISVKKIWEHNFIL